ncbi:TVP38/TMEM64 family inner membrane protein YdjZ [Peptococcaceae bacterium CEB3]|nr:TVP38/TMEM64 family inner membrane protein YdjZ [Peptococcaceae bacterium CEB3]
MSSTKSRGPLNRVRIEKYVWLPLALGIFVILILAFFYFDRTNQISLMIQSLGPLGLVLAVLLMAAVCLTPIPSEGIVVLFLKIYGVYLGTFVAWFGSCVSALIIFAIARYYGRMFIARFVTAENFKMVDNWVKRKGTVGLLIARLLPIPAVIVNYVAGGLPSIKLWPYFWTAAVSIIPYYIGTALVFLGVSKELWTWLMVGGAAILAFWGIGFLLNRHPLRDPLQ